MRLAVTRFVLGNGLRRVVLSPQRGRAPVSGRVARIVGRGEARFPGREGLRDVQNDLAVRRRC
jgi:hypothetical protein